MLVNAASVILVLGTVIAAIVDVRSRRIPNRLTAAMAIAAVAFHAGSGLVAVSIVLATMGVVFAFGLLVFSAGWFGGGDVKLIAAACGLVSFPGCVSLVAFVLIAGAILALVQAARARRLVSLVRDASRLATTGVASASPTLVPYGVAIAAGSTVYAGSIIFSVMRLAQ